MEMLLLLLLLALSGTGCYGVCSVGETALECRSDASTLNRADLSLCTASAHRIRSLTISSSKQPSVSTIDADAFLYFTMLRCLSLRALSLTSLPDTILASLLALEQLDLAANRIRVLPSALFVNVSQLERLDLSSNRLSQLPPDLFNNQIALRSLNLSTNLLTSLPIGLFDNLIKLEHLDLSANRLTVVGARAPPLWPIGVALNLNANALPPCWNLNGSMLTPPSSQWWWCFRYYRVITGSYSQPSVTIDSGNFTSSINKQHVDSVLVWHSPKNFLYDLSNDSTWQHKFGLYMTSSVSVEMEGVEITYFRPYFAGVWSLLRVESADDSVQVVTQVLVQCQSSLRRVYIWSLFVSAACTVAMILAGLLTAMIRYLVNTRCFTRKILVVSALSLEDLQYSPRTQRKRFNILRRYEANREALLASEARLNPTDPSSGSDSLLTSTAGSLDEAGTPDSPQAGWLPPHRLATVDLFSHGATSETEPETPGEEEYDVEEDDGDGVGSWWRVEISERLRAGMFRHVDQVRLRMREQRLNMEESTSRMMRQLRSGSQVAALKMRSGLATSMDAMKWKVRNMTELCGGGTANLGQTVSVSTLVTDMDTQTTTQRRVVDVTAV